MVSKHKRIRAQFRTHMPQKLTAEIINAAIEGFESQKRRIDSQIDELRQLLNPVGTEAAPASAAPAPKRKISAAGRRRMAAAQQARWAKIRGEAELSVIRCCTQSDKAKKEVERGRQEGHQRSHEKALGVETSRSSEATANRQQRRRQRRRQPARNRKRCRELRKQ